MEEDFKGSIKKSEYDINTEEEESDNEEEYDTEEEYFNGYTKEEYDKMFESGYDLPSWENIVQLVSQIHGDKVKDSVAKNQRLKACYEEIGSRR